MKANEYFTVHQPLANVYHIEDRIGMYATLLVGTKGAFLVDTGVGIGDLRAAVESLTDKPLTVVNTHGHVDHYGGNYQFDRVLLNPKDNEVAKRSIELMDIREIVLDRMAKEGCVPQGFDRQAYFAYNLDNLAPLDENAVFDLGGMTVQCIPMPSHTPGMTGFYIDELKLLLGGDSVCAMTCLFFEEASDLETHIQMLHRVSKLPFEHILTYHSGHLLDRDDFEAFIECAENYDESKTVTYRDTFYPDYKGRMFVYESSKGRVAIIVCKKHRR